MIGGITRSQYNGSFNQKVKAAKRRIFDSLVRDGITIKGIKHKKLISMFFDAHDFRRPIEIKLNDFIVHLYETKQLPDPTPRKREIKIESPFQKKLNEESERKKIYRDYINSDEWKAFRLKALAHYGNRCILCDSEGTMDLHHKTYKNFMKETLADVVPLCRKCHKKHHQAY